MKIVLDAFGGDNCPNAIIDGSYLALKEYNDLQIVLTGDKALIQKYIQEKKYDESKIEIIDASEVITCNDVPTDAIKTKKDSSLVKAVETLKSDEEVKALISTGSTGAILACGFLKIGRIKGVSRPALAAFIPTKKPNKMVLLLDCGANADCKPINYCHFAVMGSIYYKNVFGTENPKVALLNIGTEDTKGNESAKAAFAALKQMPINFVGNMEARDFMSGDYDVVVCDGFNGNILLKSTEGAISFAMKQVKSALTSNIFTKLAALVLKPKINKMKKVLDYNKYGGSPFIGCKKTIIKSHGSSKAETILASIKQAYTLEKLKINEEIEHSVSELPKLEEE